jgi:hypothetical protein
LIRGITTLGYQRFRLAKSPGRVGQRIRRRAAAAIAQQGPHYRSWGRDLGVRYGRGALIGDRLPPPVSDPEFYIPSVRAGGRLPHIWLEDGDRRVSTLDLVDRDDLTLLVSDESHSVWTLAAEGLPLSVVPVGDARRDIFHTSVVPEATPRAPPKHDRGDQRRAGNEPALAGIPVGQVNRPLRQPRDFGHLTDLEFGPERSVEQPQRQ